MPARRLALPLLLLALLASACSGGSGSGSAAGDGAASAWVEVAGRCSEAPQVTIDTKAEPPTELVIEDVCEGSGDAVAEGATVTAHYVGARLADATVFDSSWDRGEQATFSLDQVIPGWSRGLPGMKVGGRRILVIPAELGYGENPPAGYPAGTLVFVVDISQSQ